MLPKFRWKSLVKIGTEKRLEAAYRLHVNAEAMMGAPITAQGYRYFIRTCFVKAGAAWNIRTCRGSCCEARINEGGTTDNKFIPSLKNRDGIFLYPSLISRSQIRERNEKG
jgi:hypothetical protein